MNLRDLYYLVAVAEQKSFSKAANQCAISQPTLSNQIKKLEKRLEVQIFERDSKNVRLTQVGDEIIEVARRITNDANKIKQIAKLAVNNFENKITMGAFPTLANYVFPEYVFRLKQIYDDMKITIIEEKTDVLINMLLTSKIDVAFLALPVEDDRLEGVTLFEDPFYLAVYQDHPLAEYHSIDLHNLVNEDLLLLDEGHCLRSQILKLCSTTQSLGNDFRAASLETLRVMVKAGIGITLMPSVCIYPDESSISYIPIVSEPFRTIGLFWRKNNIRKAFFNEVAINLTYKPEQEEF
ncbi:MAG: DNA-binding transcriptional regulator OxyR [Methylotenera sp.]|jgi:LysR family hydrogen peroxide-inducible transcriptional activator|uniref:LysR substrate-binding domain-containing protein n=1 Tax=Methylotenera TaxID=359407 RepID=UPI00037FE6FB|nr:MULTISPECIES: LysR substrate-binding domain-containing protein [Methylotenera]MDP3777571.1 LysR substrate-binding domain-containing protein [Methylotenera sp.]PPC96348.1 MAG: DNA-binding transcriptional regulator OxyR [Methylotenera sp.]PPD00011.1 MAG: DNA-binding transcriptional regulator OxyR [Methylotenera sp.]